MADVPAIVTGMAGAVEEVVRNENLALGRPLPKKTIEWMDLVAATVAALVCAIAVAVVAVDRIAWQLGYNGQIIVVGLLIGVMSICLKAIVPTMFLMCEVTFGNSTLQNIDAIRTNSSLATRVDWWWRTALLLLIALPLALSVAYKQYPQGSATVRLGPISSLYNESFGMHPPPGLLPLGWNTGLLLMFNATMPFLTQSTNQSATTDAEYNDIANDVLLPSFPQSFGFNVLVINENTTALLDAPHPEWLEEVQNTLGEGDVLEIGANVLALVTTYDPAVEPHRTTSQDSWWSFDESNAIWWNEYTLIYKQWFFWLRYYPPPDFNPRAAATFLSLYNTSGHWEPNAYLFATTRMECYGRWNITQTSANLMNTSSCDSNSISSTGLLHDTSHLILTNNSGLALTLFYPPVLAEILAPFLTRMNSHWFKPTMATAVSSMHWSRIAASIGPSSPHYQDDDSFINDPAGTPIRVRNATLSYQSRDPKISWTTPSMRKAPTLFIVIALQPAIVLGMIVVIVGLRKVPVGKGFGMVAILAGVKPESLGLLSGAEVSGELQRSVYLGTVKEGHAGERKGSGQGLRYYLSEDRVPDEARLK